MIQATPQRVNLLNISLDNLSMDELLSRLQYGGVVVTPNADHLVKLQHDPEFHQVYRHADYVVCDSKILLFVSRILGTPVQEKISGSDLFPAFYQYYKDDPDIRIFLLGGPPGVAETAQEQINQKVDRKIVVDTYCPPFGFEHDDAENEKIIEIIRRSNATVLAVGVGAPKQEKWIYKHRHRLPNIKLFLAIGATINFEAGYTKRSPAWMSNAGIEWLYRLLSEPRRLWRRYLVEDMQLLFLVARRLMNCYDYRLPIGQLLQEAGLLSAQQVDTILSAQAEYRRRFGDLVVEQGWLHPQTIDFFSEEFPRLPTHQDIQPIGHYLKSAALLNEQQIHAILAEQSQCGRKFGEIAVVKGWVPQPTVELLLANLPGQTISQNQQQPWGIPRINIPSTRFQQATGL
jgi:exopolysaccharide biosynthesis WecB/TagA/CpsF family protein